MNGFRGWTRPPGEFRRWLPEGFSEPAAGDFVAGLPVTDLGACRSIEVVAESPRCFQPCGPAADAASRFRLDVSALPIPAVLLNDA